jgi:hypothetical protein
MYSFYLQFSSMIGVDKPKLIVFVPVISCVIGGIIKVYIWSDTTGMNCLRRFSLEIEEARWLEKSAQR